MRAKVIREFRDKNDFTHLYKVGQVVDFDDARVKELIKKKCLEPEKEDKDFGKKQTKTDKVEL